MYDANFNKKDAPLITKKEAYLLKFHTQDFSKKE